LLQQIIQRLSVDLEVRPRATRKRAINPDYLTTVDGNSNFPPEPCSSKLETVPFLVKLGWVVDLEISSIN
jgi:hypothetical protein